MNVDKWYNILHEDNENIFMGKVETPKEERKTPFPFLRILAEADNSIMKAAALVLSGLQQWESVQLNFLHTNFVYLV